MNRLPLARRIEVVKSICDGNSIRHTARDTGIAVNTIRRLLRNLAPDPLALTPKNAANLIAQLEVRELVNKQKARVRREVRTGRCSKCGNPLIPSREISSQGSIQCLTCPLCGEVIFGSHVPS